MTDTPNRPPLWREMCRAMAEVEMGARATKMYAAEIRALRDWLVPEEEEAPRADFDCEPRPSYNFKTKKCDGPLRYEHGDYLRRQFRQDELDLKWKERQRLRALLTAEADRAEETNHDHAKS